MPALWRKKMSRLRERNRKIDRRRKIASVIVKTAKSLSYGIVVERLPNRVGEKTVGGVTDSRLRHSIYQAAFRGMV